MSKQINIGGRIHSTEVGNVSVGANEVLDDTKGKKQNVINADVDAELLRLDQSKQNNLTFDNTPTENSTNPVTSGGVYAANITLHELIEAILVLIPSAASALNQLADKAFVNSSVSTATATFRGTYNVVTDLELAYDATHEQIATKLGQVIATADNNDYAFVQVPVSATSTDIRRTERYKFNGTVWGYEYDLNTSGFTAAQWEAINSAITAALVQKLSALPTAQELAAALLGKQDILIFDNAPTSGSSNPVKSGGVYTAVNDEKVSRENADTGLGNRITAIENVIPSAASSSNKLVDNSAMSDAIGVVTALIGQMDATFNLTTTDGHITLHVTQVDGVITSVQVQSSDIASAAALTLVTNRVTTAEGDIETLQDLYNALQQSAPQVIEPTDTWPVANPSNTVIYRVIDRVNTPPKYYSDYMWNGTSTVLMATYNNAIDDEPTAGSDNLVKSGGIYNKMYDNKDINISSRQQFISGYATAAGVFTDIGGSSQDGFRYIPVEAGKTYRLVGSYLGNATGKANIVFSESIPSTGGSCTVITHDQAVATPFDIKYQATENGYLCIYINAVNYAYTFYLSDDELITDELSDNIKGIEDNIYSEDGKAVSSTFLTGNISNGVARNIGASVAYGFSYIPVIKGHKYHISGTFLNTAGTYAGIAFSESVIATNDAVVVVDMGIASGTINYSYEAQLNGYLYVYSTDAVFVEYGKDTVFLNKSDILSFCKQQPMDIVGKVYQKKFVSTSTSKIVDTTSASAGSYVIPVTEGQRYLVRGRVVAYTQYALIAFTEALSADTTAKIILAASEADNNYEYTQVVEIAKNGYLMVWSSLDAYGSANYVEILPLLERITVDNDYYLPNALKIQTFGDSITDASWGDKSSWVSYLPDNVPIQSLTIVNCGIGGENIPNLVNVIQNGGTNQGGESVPALQTDTELVVLLIGTNDWSAGIQLETSKNALAQVFQYIINNSKAKILFCTPTQRTFSGTAVNAYGEKLNANNISLREFCNGLIEVCNVYSVPVLNLNADANINSLNIMDYSQDGLHPNRNGDIRISDLICKKIKEMIRH